MKTHIQSSICAWDLHSCFSPRLTFQTNHHEVQYNDQHEGQHNDQHKCHFLINCKQLKTCNKYSKALTQVLYCYKLFGTLGYQLKSSQHRSFIQEILITPKKSWGDPHPHLFVLEVQDQTIPSAQQPKTVQNIQHLS